MKKWIIIVVIVGLLGYAVYDFVDSKNDEAETEEEQESDVGIEQGDTAPDFELETIDGETVKLSDYQGEKVMVNFWGSWCPPCRAEMPDIEKFHKKGDGHILSVNLTETENSERNVEDFIDEYELTFDVLMDKDTAVGNTYRAQSLPTTYLIDTKGKIHNIAVGPLNYDQMVEAFDDMD